MTKQPVARQGPGGHEDISDANWHNISKQMSAKIRHMIETGRLSPQNNTELQIRRDYLAKQNKKKKRKR